jgi:delta14-sterol reductase
MVENMNSAGNVQKKAVKAPEFPSGEPFIYFFMLYLGALLTHRENREEERRKRKYGADWERYISIVPSRKIPSVY